MACVICFIDKQGDINCTRCTASFCRECIMRWLATHTTCPYCMVQMRDPESQTNDITGYLEQLDSDDFSDVDTQEDIKKHVSMLINLYGNVIFYEFEDFETVMLDHIRTALGPEYIYYNSSDDNLNLTYAITKTPHNFPDTRLFPFTWNDRETENGEFVLYPPLDNSTTLQDLVEGPARPEVTQIYFGHDGVIDYFYRDSNRSTVPSEREKLMSLFLEKYPNLRMVWTCAYYCEFHGHFARMGIREISIY